MSNEQTHPSQKTGSLTKYAPGSVQECWTIAYPLILTSITTSLMIFFDRLIVAQYSTKAMTAVASAGLVVVTVEFGFMAIAGIAEAFVGQYNGAKDYKRVSEPVWQMLWFSLGITLITTPLAFYGAEFFVADPFDELGAPYFKYLMLFAPLTSAIAALSSFFVGLGNPKIVTYVTGLANILNIVLDYVLVLGLEGWVDPMGTKGAAIATNIALGSEVIIFLYIFFRKKYRETYNTLDFRFRFAPFWKCIKIGTPNAISHMIELSAWAYQLNLLAKVSEVHVTVQAIGQSIFLLFMFISDGMSRAMTALAANFMGANTYDVIPKSIKSAIKIHFMFVIPILFIFIVFHDQLIEALIEGDYSTEILEMIRHYSRISMIWIWLFLCFDGILWIFVGLLTASGDTKFIMMTNGFCAWLFAILPLYIFVYLLGGSPAISWFLITVYIFINFCLFYWRYSTGSWRINKVKN